MDKLCLQVFLHDSHIVTLAVENCHDIYLVFGFFIRIEEQVILVRQESIAAAFQHPISGDSTAFRELLQNFCFLPKLFYKADGEIPILRELSDVDGNFPEIGFCCIREFNLTVHTSRFSNSPRMSAKTASADCTLPSLISSMAWARCV